jgi:hypothetical protein
MLQFLPLLVLSSFLSAVRAKGVLLIVADDAGFEGGVFGNPVIRTPNLDALGRKSMKFDKAFTSVSSCSPRHKVHVDVIPLLLNLSLPCAPLISLINSVQIARTEKVKQKSTGCFSFFDPTINPLAP